MKKILYASFFLAMVFSACKKQPNDPAIHIPVPTPYITTVQKWLKQNIAAGDYANIDFGHYRISKQQAHWYLRLSLKSIPLSTNFLLVQTDSIGNAATGKIIHMEKTTSVAGIYNGLIDIVSLDKKTIFHSVITKGYIEAWHPKLFSANTKETSFPVPYDELPEVIVTAYIPSKVDSGLSYADYMFFQSIFNGNNSSGSSDGGFGWADNGSGSGVYSPLDGPTDAGNNVGEYIPNHDINVNFDNSAYRPAIDMEAWMKCFTDIPDEGSTCTITLCAELPVDDDPFINVNIFTGATGHTFLQLRKTNGLQSVTQIIGFTAENPINAITQADSYVPGKTVDNAGHKYNASLTMNVNAPAFNTAIEKMKLLSAMPYSILNFDCLDYDLAVINAIRGANPIILPKVPVGGNGFSMISTGELLYGLLADMKQQGDLEAPNIFIGGPLFAGLSQGPCN